MLYPLSYRRNSYFREVFREFRNVPDDNLFSRVRALAERKGAFTPETLNLAWTFPRCLHRVFPVSLASRGWFQPGLMVFQDFFRGLNQYRRFLQDVDQEPLHILCGQAV